MRSKLSILICTIAVCAFLCVPQFAIASEDESASDTVAAQETVVRGQDAKPTVQSGGESGAERDDAQPAEEPAPTPTTPADDGEASEQNTVDDDVSSSGTVEEPLVEYTDDTSAEDEATIPAPGEPLNDTDDSPADNALTESEATTADDPAIQKASGTSTGNAYAKEDAKALASKGALAAGNYALSSKAKRTSVLQVAKNSTANGRSTVVKTYVKGTKSQVWRITYDAKGYATITNVNSGLVLYVKGNKAAVNASVVQAVKRAGVRGQLWIVTVNSDGTCRIESALALGYSLDLKGSTAADGTVGVLAKGSASRTQRWYALQSTPKVRKTDYIKQGWYTVNTKLSSSFNLYGLKNATSGKTTASLKKGILLGGFAFKFVRVGDYYRIYAGAANGQSVLLSSNSIIPGSTAGAAKNTNKASLFSAQYDKVAKGYKLVNVATGLTLAVTSGSAVNGAKISGEHAINGSKAQAFTMKARSGIVCRGVYAVKSVLSGKRALTSSKYKGTFYSYRKDTSQKWYIAPLKGKQNVYIIESTATGKRLSGMANAQPATQAAADADKSQWWIPYVGNKGIVWKNVKTKRPLSVNGTSCPEGATAINANKGVDARQFTLASVPTLESGVYQLRAGSNTGYVIEVKGASEKAGAAVQMYGRKSDNNQRWIYNTKKHTLTNLNSGLVLQAKSTAAGAALVQAKATSAATQQWTIQYAGGGKYRIVSGANADLVITAGSTTKGGTVKNAKDSGGKLQLWKPVETAFSVSPKGFNLITSIVNNGHGPLNADYIVIHETANPGATALNHRDLWKNNDYYSDYAVHYTLDWTGNCYYCVPENRLCWQVGNGNSHVIGIELCHATNQSDFNKVWNAGIQWAVWQLNKHGWGIDRLISHNECRLKWGGTDHTDPDDYFEAFGKSWAEFKAAVKKQLLN